MNTARIFVTSGGVALIGLTLWFFFGKRPEIAAQEKNKLYACPMHPWITSSDPTAECTSCGMKLVHSDSQQK